MTIKDIARISGYGVSTVSRALNDHPDVSAEAKKHIVAVAAANNFVPNSNARQLKITQNNSVIIIVKGEFNVFFSRLIENIQSEIVKLDWIVQVHYIDTDDDEVQIAKNLSIHEKPLGIIFLGGNMKNFVGEFDEINLPCVLSSTSAGKTDYPNLSSVSVDDTFSGEAAIDKLIASGHREIGIIGGDIKTFCSTGQRYIGCLKSFEKHDIKFDDKAFEYSEFSYESAYEAAKALLTRKTHLTAIFAMSDIMAIGAIRAIQDMGMCVPEDISVLGFDGIDIATYYNPRITTFKQPETELAAKTVSLLQDLINKKSPQQILLKASYLEGGSVRKLTENTAGK